MPKPGYTMLTLKCEVAKTLRLKAREHGMELNAFLVKLLNKDCPSEAGS